jgi:hypothetical protein
MVTHAERSENEPDPSTKMKYVTQIAPKIGNIDNESPNNIEKTGKMISLRAS